MVLIFKLWLDIVIEEVNIRDWLPSKLKLIVKAFLFFKCTRLDRLGIRFLHTFKVLILLRSSLLILCFVYVYLKSKYTNILFIIVQFMKQKACTRVVSQSVCVMCTLITWNGVMLTYTYPHFFIKFLITFFRFFTYQ